MGDDMKSIEISFPVDVKVTDDFYMQLDKLIGKVCEEYEKTHPGRVMWVFGQGQKITYMPMTKAEEDAGKGMEFDDSIYSIECSEREDYKYKCTKCGHPQEDHGHCTYNPPAGDCKFSVNQ